MSQVDFGIEPNDLIIVIEEINVGKDAALSGIEVLTSTNDGIPGWPTSMPPF
jgi:hypothetical protein